MFNYLVRNKRVIILYSLLAGIYWNVCAMVPSQALEAEGLDTVVCTCTDGAHIEVSRRLWNQFFTAVPEQLPFDQRTAIDIIDLITRADADQVYTPDCVLAQRLQELHGHNALDLLHNYYVLRPIIQQPLAHLVAWHAARNLYSQHETQNLQETFDTLKHACANYAALPLMYFYFQLCRAEHGAHESLLIDQIPVTLIEAFFESHPQWELVSPLISFVRYLTDISKMTPYKRQRIIHELICQDHVLLLRYAQVILQRAHIDFTDLNFSKTHETRDSAYEQLKYYLQIFSATTIRALLNCYKLSPNHVFQEFKEDHGVLRWANSTSPLLIAVVRGDPQIVEMLLRAGADPDKVVKRPGEQTITALELAQATLRDGTSSSTFSESGTEIWYGQQDDGIVRRQRQIIEILQRTPVQPMPIPDVCVMCADLTVHTSAESCSTVPDSNYLSVPAVPLSPRFARRNALGQPPSLPAMPTSSEELEALGHVEVVNTFGCGCGCGVTKKNVTKAVTVL